MNISKVSEKKDHKTINDSPNKLIDCVNEYMKNNKELNNNISTDILKPNSKKEINNKNKYGINDIDKNINKIKSIDNFENEYIKLTKNNKMNKIKLKINNSNNKSETMSDYYDSAKKMDRQLDSVLDKVNE